MTDLPDPMAPHVPDALADLKAQIETELAHGKFDEVQLAELREIQHEHAERLDDIVASHAADVESIADSARDDVGVWHQEHADDLAIHHVEPHDLADLMQPIDAAAIDQTEARFDLVSDAVELQIDTWRQIVEWRAEQGDESPDVVEAQLAQLDEAESDVSQIQEHHHDVFESARQSEDIMMDDVRETNLPPAPTTIDAEDYHLPPGEHDIPTAT